MIFCEHCAGGLLFQSASRDTGIDTQFQNPIHINTLANMPQTATRRPMLPFHSCYSLEVSLYDSVQATSLSSSRKHAHSLAPRSSLTRFAHAYSCFGDRGVWPKQPILIAKRNRKTKTCSSALAAWVSKPGRPGAPPLAPCQRPA